MKKQKRAKRYWRDRMRKYRKRKGRTLRAKERAYFAGYYAAHSERVLAQQRRRRKHRGA